MSTLKINHLAVLVCVVLMFAIGFLWYGQLFGAQWMQMVGLDMELAKANAPGPSVWIINIISCVAPLYSLAWVLTKLNTSSGVQGAAIGFVLSFTFHLLPQMTSNMFAQFPNGLVWITCGYALTCMTLSGFILGAWTKKA